MPQQKALDFFASRYNCAQSVAKAFQDQHNISDEIIESYKAMGGGRADQGLCGALFAASKLVVESRLPELQKQFTEQAGSDKCREIRKINKLKCRDCVALAAKLVSQIENQSSES